MEDGGEEVEVEGGEVGMDGECKEEGVGDEVEEVHDRTEQLERESMAQLDPQIF